MKLLVGIIIGLLLASQAPLAWQAWEKSQQCDNSVAKKASSELGKLAAELDLVDCSFSAYYKAELKGLIGG